MYLPYSWQLQNRLERGKKTRRYAMKRIMTVLLACICLFQFAICMADECQHSSLTLVSETYQNIASTTSPTSGHDVVTTKTYRCKDCNQLIPMVSTSFSSHTAVEMIEDIGHVGNNKHQYRYHASCCNVTFSMIIYCPGPPCNSMYN